MTNMELIPKAESLRDSLRDGQAEKHTLHSRKSSSCCLVLILFQRGSVSPNVVLIHFSSLH